MLTPVKGAFVYNDKINAEKILNDFVKDKRYEKFEKHGGNSFSTHKLI